MNPTPTNPIALVDPETNELVGLDNPAQLPNLMNLGYRPASPAELQAHALKQQYDTFGQAATAFGEGAIDTLAPVIAPALERALGVSSQDQRYRAQFHPLAHGAGQALGAVGGAALGVGVPGIAARLGAGTAARLGGGILASAAGSALEGAIYSASDVANRAVLQDPGLTAESAAREVGMTTLLSGGLGALGGLGKKFALDHADQWSEDLKDFAADRTLKSLGGIQSDRANLVKRYGEEGYLQIMREISEHPMKPTGPFSTPKTSFDVGDKMQQSAWAAMKAEMDKAGQAGVTVSGDDLLAKFRGVIDEMRPNPWAQSAVNRLGTLPSIEDPAGSGVLGIYAKGIGGKALPLEGVHGLRKQLSDAIGFSRGAVDFDSNLAKGAMFDFRNIASDSIEDALKASGVGSEAWKAANRQYQLGSIVQKVAQRGLNAAEGNNIVSPTELLSGLASGIIGGGEGGPGSVAHALGHGLIGGAATALIRRQGSHVLAWAGLRASRALDALSSGVESQVGQAVERAFSGAAGIGSVKAADHIFTPENYSDRAKQINQRLANPDNFSLADPVLDTYLRPVMDEMRTRVQSAVTLLGAGLPKYDTTGPLDPEYQPSGTELAKLNRTSEVIHDPISVLAHIADGTILPDHVAALDAVWPAHAQAIRMKALEQLATEMAAGRPIPPRLRYGLSILLGQDLGRSTSGQAIAAVQAAYAARSPQQGGPPPPGSRAEKRVRNVETKMGDRMATSTDSAMAHLSRQS